MGVLSVIGLLFAVFQANSTLRHLFPEKVWSHKTNTLKKLYEAKSTFCGVELDLVFDTTTSVFDVNHPPDKSNGLSLDTYMKRAGSSPGLKLWLDFKNLTRENETIALKSLNLLVAENDLDKSNIIVESTEVCLLNEFNKSGYLTSYYLPGNISRLEKMEQEKVLFEIQMVLKSCPQTYISTEYKDYELVSEYFPEEKKLIWFTVYGGLNIISARVLLYKLLLDHNVEVLLIPFS